MVRNLHLQTKWILGSKGRRNDGNNLSIRNFVPPVPTKQSRGERNIKLLFRTVSSANQLSIYGATADFSDKVPKRVGCSGVKQAFGKSLPSSLRMNNSGEAPRQEHERKFEQLPQEDKKLSKLCSDAGLKLVVREQYF